ncbi:hypothetical protein C8R46DRAFT_556444 [Mycena filopes]|nr:hypothetical protein C8R46DRAFT_556444 [Mycena filopes]
MIHPAPPSPRKPPQKKRHTKPCRYFQTGSCPHAAQEDCDFAHVFSDQSAVSLPPPKQCRYYLQGNCTNGIWCQYRHGDSSPGSDDVSLLKDYQNVNHLSSREYGARPPPVQVRPAPGVIPPAVYIPSPTYFTGAYTGCTVWAYPHDVRSPLDFTPPPHLLSSAAILSPAASIESIDDSTPSSSSSPTSSVSDDAPVLPPTADSSKYYSGLSSALGSNESRGPGIGAYLGPGYGEHFINVNPYSPPPTLSVVTSPYGAAPFYDIFSPKSQPPSAGFYPTEAFPQSPQSPINRQKLASYKTKPCRYFKPGSVCPNGLACTFIHADPGRLDAAPSPASVKQLPQGLPSRPLSTKEENSRKGYFPISWRVIGGGVLLSGMKSDSADDQSDTSADSDSLDGMFSRVLEIKIPSPASASMIDFPSSESSTDTEEDSMTPTRGSQTHTRQRASSIPSTPMTTHIDHLRLFSAESPGGL